MNRLSVLPLVCLVTSFALLTPAAPACAAAVDPGAAETPAERLRVGLVLGGGGARGATHIGVLRELERMRIPIDAIAGTSMGAFVGGLYASGMSAAELESLLGTIDWSGTMNDEPHRSELNFRRKQDDEQFPTRLRLGLDGGGLRMPMGLIQGHRLDLLLNELTIDVAGVRDFDKLPIPFRAVAADIERAEPYVIASGELAAALRASMSVPGILAPAKLDGRLLVDGGLFANLPVDVMREMDVDVIIAVSAEFPLYEHEELDSALKVSEQMLTILIRQETLRQMALLGDDDVLLEPDLGIFASTNFAAVEETLEPGAAAARAAAGRLEELSVSPAEYSAYAAARTADPTRAVVLDFVRLQHDGGLSDAALHARIRVQPGDVADPRRMAADVDRLYGLNLYEQVSYHIVEENGSTGLVYVAKTRSWGENDLQFGISLEDDFDGGTAFNIRTRLTRVGINDNGAEWRSDLQLGSAPLVFSEFFQPLRPGSEWFIAPRLSLSRFSRNVFEMDERVGLLRISEARIAMDIGRQLGNAAELRAGIYRGAGNSRLTIGAPALAQPGFDAGGWFGSLLVDSRDDARFPTSGVRSRARWQGARTRLGADSRRDSLELDFENNWSRGRNTLQLGLSYATTISGESAVQDLFPLGGFLRLSGLERNAISGPHAALARLTYRRAFGAAAGGLFEQPFYLGASLEAGNVWSSRSAISVDSALVNGSLFAAIDTVLGPVFVAAGLAEGGDRSFYLFIGAPPR